MSLRRVLTVVFLSCSLAVNAQIKFSEDPAKFPQDVTSVLGSTKQEAAIQVATTFNGLWSGGFTEAQKKKIIEVSVKIAKSKKLKINPQLTDYFAVLNATKNKNLPSSDFDTLMYIFDRSIDDYDARQLGNLYGTIRLFLEQSMLYKSNYNKLRVSGGTFRFRYMAPVIDKYDPAFVEQPDTTKKDDTFQDFDNPQQETDEWGTINTDNNEVSNSGNANINDNIDASLLSTGYVAPPQPPVDGAVIYFENADFFFVTQYDSSKLQSTTGSVVLKDNLYVGKGGKFDWSIAGVPSSEIYCDLAEYNFTLQSTKLVSEGAKLHYPARTDSVVEGIFEFNSRKHKTPEEAVFPRFKSFNANIPVKGLGPNIVYHGGLSLSGKKIYSSSIDEGYSTIEVTKQDTVVVRAVSNRFELGDSLISADICTIVLFMGKDSIYHPGVTFKYNKSDTKLRVHKHSNFKYAPFINSYHDIEMFLDAGIWDLNTTSIDFTIINAKNQVAAVFESIRYYQANKYSEIQGIYRFHPLQLVVGYSETETNKAYRRDPSSKKRVDTFNAEDVAKAYKLEVNTVKSSMYYLMKLGYIDYNARTGLIKLRDKALHYVAARRDRSDYDNLSLVSISPEGTNSTLDLNSKELTIRGVDKIFLSDSLNVFIVPKNRQVIFLKNRDFNCDGKINTQNFQFIGEKFGFVYDSFLVHLPKIDEIKLAVDEKQVQDQAKGIDNQDNRQQKGNKKARVLGNELKYSSGTLYINKPNNKSGRVKLAQYPIFDATTGATVFFNKDQIAGGAYDTTIQFKIPPFKIDSLSSDDPQAIGFEGEFASGGIFPPFKEKLVVMPDYSLGFDHKVPKEGFQLYEGKGKFYNKITMNNQGLRGDGEIHYLTTTAYSKDFVFFKDSVITIGTKSVTKEGTHPETVSPDVTFPEMTINDYEMKWLPRKDSMYLTNRTAPFEIYNNTASLQGVANITSKGMYGEGVLTTRGSEAQSLHFHFEQTKYAGRESTFEIKSDNPKKPALRCISVKLDFDLVKGEAVFSPEVAGFASNDFPYAQYRSSLDKGVWDLNKKTVTMSMPEGGDISKSYFYSTRPDQDSLVFNATSAVYDIPSQNLNIYGIPFIKVADSKIFPDSNWVAVQENAVIKTLTKAKIVIDTITGYHYLYDGRIDILGRKKFGGEATYQYVNLGSDTLAFQFQDFNLEPSQKKKEGDHTVATGFITEDQPLRIADKVLYKGKIILHAENKNLSFEGFIRLDLKGALNFSEWIKYDNNGEQKEVIVDLTDPKGSNGAPLFNGLHFDNTKQLYTTFISQKKTGVDKDMMLAKGILRIDSGEFVVGTKERLDLSTFKGNYYAYNDSTSCIRYGGKFDYMDPNPDISVLASGNGFAMLDSNDFRFNNLLLFKFNLNPAITKVFDKELKAAYVASDTTELANPDSVADARKRDLLFKLAEVEDDKAVNAYKAKQALGYTPLPLAFPDIAKSPITFSNVDMRWSVVYKAFYSVGKLNVSNVLKTDINKEMNGYIEIRKGNAGDIVNIYLEPNADTWYFITYENRRLAMITSSDAVNKAIAGKSKGEVMDNTKFNFVAADLMEKVKFVNNFREFYLGLSPDGQHFQQYQPENVQKDTNPAYKDEEERRQKERQDNPAYNNEEKKEYEKKEGKVIQEDDPNREKKVHNVDDKEQLRKDQQKMKDLFK
ncbi:MAG: hypothetical protein ACJ75J_05980 [Cytophagaceae bacterium]